MSREDAGAALDRLLRQQQAGLTRQYEQLMEGHTRVARLVREYHALRTLRLESELIERVEGLDQVQGKVEELVQQTSREFLAFVPGGAQPAEGLETSKAMDQAMIDRGVAMRSIYLDSLRNDSLTAERAHWLVRLGAGLRTVPVLPLRLLIADRTVAIVPVDPDNSVRGAVRIAEPGVIAALVALFEQLWKSALPFGESAASDPGKPTRQEQELLNLLAQGTTDEVAARRLGVSLRTVRRMVAGLMGQLGAHSRFEAGLRVAEKGWLLPRD